MADNKNQPQAQNQQQAGQQDQQGQAPDTGQLLSTLTQVFATFQNQLQSQLQSQAPMPNEGAALTAANKYNEVVAALQLRVPPDPPKALNAKGNSSTNSIDLTWTTDDRNNVDGFKIGRCKGQNCNTFAEIARLSSDKNAYQDTDLPSKGTYRYQVTAFNVRGEAHSNIQATIN